MLMCWDPVSTAVNDAELWLGWAEMLPFLQEYSSTAWPLIVRRTLPPFGRKAKAHRQKST